VYSIRNLQKSSIFADKIYTVMGFLDFIFGKKQKIENDFFGTMLFFEFKKEPHKNYFECSKHLKPAGKIIEIAIDGDRAGTVEKQIAFFKCIESHYPEICRTAAPLVEREYKNWKEDFRITDFQKQFEPVYITLPRCETAPVEWEISFETALDEHTVIGITRCRNKN
jgi:hypothetical protein